MCEGQLGDATVGTDVRIRNGLLSCHECYIASRGDAQKQKDTHRLAHIGISSLISPEKLHFKQLFA